MHTKVIGIVGGVASGKTLVAERLKQWGAEILDGDRAGHEVLCSVAVKQAAGERWGQQIFGADGQIDRASLATIVFSPTAEGAAELEYLEHLTHPRIGELLRHQLEQFERQETPVAILDAPVMFKAGWDKLCDQIIFVEAPRELRLARALERGWSQEEFEAREAIQQPLDLKRKRAHRVIDNSESIGTTEAQVRQLWHSLLT